MREPDVARGGGQRQHFDAGLRVRHQDGQRVVHAGVGVDQQALHGVGLLAAGPRIVATAPPGAFVQASA